MITNCGFNFSDQIMTTSSGVVVVGMMLYCVSYQSQWSWGQESILSHATALMSIRPQGTQTTWYGACALLRALAPYHVVCM